MYGTFCITNLLCILLSAVAYAFSSVMIKTYSQKENPVTLSGYQFIAGAR